MKIAIPLWVLVLVVAFVAWKNRGAFSGGGG